MSQREGVVKFRAEHTPADLPAELAPLAFALSARRRLWRALGWLGQDPARYAGYGFGNLSTRLPAEPTEPATPAPPRGRRRFLVTGSQTGHLAHLPLAGYALVERWDLARNRLVSTGRAHPSSESLTHAALYDLDPAIRAVAHLHAPELWRRRDLPRTDPAVEYGTPEMASEVARLWRELGEPQEGVAAMGGHQDGVVAWGEGLDRIGLRLLTAAGEATETG